MSFLEEYKQSLTAFQKELCERDPKVVLPGDAERLDKLMVMAAKLVGAKEFFQ
jgi:hypothetical protein